MKKIQVNMDLFIDMYRLVMRLQSDDLSEGNVNLCKSIETRLEAKIDAMARRDYYTLYKTAETEKEREDARKAYLDAAGIHKDWRY